MKKLSAPRSKLRIVAAILIGAVLLAGAVFAGWWFTREQEPPLVPSETPPLTPTENPTAAPEPSPSKSPSPLDILIPIEIGPMIDIDWPEYPVPKYTPEAKVFPLTNTISMYSMSLTAPVTFIDENLEPFALPFEVRRYNTVVADFEPSSLAIAYTLTAADPEKAGGYVLMLADGTVPRGEDGRYITLARADGGDIDFFSNLGSAVVTRDIVTDLCGLYDLEERRELLPMQYERIDTYLDAFFYAEQGDYIYLLDIRGNVLFEAASEDWTSFTRDYRIDVEERCFYLRKEHFGQMYGTLQKWNGYYLLTDGRLPAGTLTVTDLEGRPLHALSFKEMYTYKEAIVLYSLSGFVVFGKDGSVRRFPVDLAGSYSLGVRGLRGDSVLYYVPDMAAKTNIFYLVNEAGEVQEVAEDWTSPYYSNDSRIYYDPTVLSNQWQLRSEAGEILLISDRQLYIAGNFVLATTDSVPRTVYALDGTRLLENMYGCIDETPGPGGGLFVYLDPYTCVLLYPDGSMTPVPNAPVVELVYGTWMQ